MGWLIALGILILLAALPLGVCVRYDSGGPLVRLVLGPFRYTLIPGKKKRKKAEKEPQPKEEAPKEPTAKQIGSDKPAPQPAQEQKKKETGGSLLDFLPLVKVAMDFLGDFRRKLRIDVLELKLILAGDDPCDLGLNYGRAWAAVGNLLPKLEQWFVIKKRNIEVECDFTASEILVIAHVELTITLGRLLAALARFAWRAVREYLKINKKRKGGAKQ